MKFNKLIQILFKKSVKSLFEEGESVEFGGKILVNMLQDAKIMKYSCKIVTASEYAAKNGIKDIDGRIIPSHRELRGLGENVLPKNLRPFSKYFPSFVKVPQAFIDIFNSKYYR